MQYINQNFDVLNICVEISHAIMMLNVIRYVDM